MYKCMRRIRLCTVPYLCYRNNNFVQYDMPMNLSNTISTPPRHRPLLTVVILILIAGAVYGLYRYLSARHQSATIAESKAQYVDFVQTLPVREPSAGQIRAFTEDQSATVVSDEQKSDFLKTLK